MSEKLQKVLARTGLASRRQCEVWISEGRVKVDGKTAKLGDRVTSHAKILFDNKPIAHSPASASQTRVLVYHKPVGELCTRSDPQNRPTVFASLPPLLEGRWILVGRLDYNTSGLLVVTNDGELANSLMHPSSGIVREYAVRVYGHVTPPTIQRLTQGVMLEDGKTRFDSITPMERVGSNQWYRVTVSEGRNRIVRRLWASQDVKVNRLMRIRFAHLTLPRNLSAQKFAELNQAEIKDLKNAVKRSD